MRCVILALNKILKFHKNVIKNLLKCLALQTFIALFIFWDFYCLSLLISLNLWDVYNSRTIFNTLRQDRNAF